MVVRTKKTHEEDQYMGAIRLMASLLMAEQDMNVSDLAEALDCSWPTAKKIKRGEMPWVFPDWEEKMVRLCEILGVNQIGDILVLQDNGEGS